MHATKGLYADTSQDPSSPRVSANLFHRFCWHLTHSGNTNQVSNGSLHLCHSPSAYGQNEVGAVISLVAANSIVPGSGLAQAVLIDH